MSGIKPWQWCGKEEETEPAGCEWGQVLSLGRADVKKGMCAMWMLKGGRGQAANGEEEEPHVVAAGRFRDAGYGQDKPEGEGSQVTDLEVCPSVRLSVSRCVSWPAEEAENF